MTQLELLGYQDITESEQKKVLEFLNECVIIDINQQIKETVVAIKQRYKFKLPDSIILEGLPYIVGIPVISADSDFNKISEAEVVYYERE